MIDEKVLPFNVIAKDATPINKAPAKLRQKLNITVLLGDPRLPDIVKKDGQFGEEDFYDLKVLKEDFASLTEFEFIYLDDHQTMVQQLVKEPPLFVFNLCDEGFNNHATQELHVPALLELLNVPYTGAGPACLALCFDKAIVNALAKRMKIPTPSEKYYTFAHQALHDNHQYPIFLKPSAADGSLGITQHALVNNSDELAQYVDYLTQNLPHSPILVQEYLCGTEYQVGILGNKGHYDVLPILEVDFSALPADLPRLLGYEHKWDPQSPYYQKVIYKEATLPEEVKHQLYHQAIQLFERLGCRDWARFDFRSNSQGEIKLLEANPNPGGLGNLGEFAGFSYARIRECVIMAAIKRLNLWDALLI